MCCKGFAKRVLPFFLTFAVGLFIASFFVSVAAPNFQFPNRGSRKKMREYNKQLKIENERLREENERLKNQSNDLENVGYQKLDLRLDVPPIPPMPPAPPAPPTLRNVPRNDK